MFFLGGKEFEVLPGWNILAILFNESKQLYLRTSPNPQKIVSLVWMFACLLLISAYQVQGFIFLRNQFYFFASKFLGELAFIIDCSAVHQADHPALYTHRGRIHDLCRDEFRGLSVKTAPHQTSN